MTASHFAALFGLPNRVAWGEVRLTAYEPNSLFRPEVAEGRKQRLRGEIILAQPVRAHALTLLLLVIVALLATWVVLGNYTRSEIAHGILVTDQPSAKVVAIRTGQIVELFVRDGDRVRAGQRLAIVRVEQSNEEGGSAIAENLTSIEIQRLLSAQQVELAGERAAAERARIYATLDGLRRQRSDIGAQIELQFQIVASTRETFDRIGKVVERGFVSRIEYERRRQMLLISQQQLAELRQQSNSLAADERRALAELARGDAEAGSAIATAQSSAQILMQQRSQALAQRAYVISAPIAGRVTALQAAVGRTVDASAPLMTVIPVGATLHAEIYAPTRAIGFVRQGQEVRLLYDAFPYQRFGSFNGRVIRISQTVLDPREIAAPLKIEEAVYRIEVSPDRQTVVAFGNAITLQPGMTLSANLILDRRSFGEWLLQPLNAVLKRNGK